MPADLGALFVADFDAAAGAVAGAESFAGADVVEDAGADPVILPGLEVLSVGRGVDVPWSSGVGAFAAELAFGGALLPPGFELSVEPDAADPVFLPGLEGLSVGRGDDGLAGAKGSAGAEAAPD
jgi:hypothetical protein